MAPKGKRARSVSPVRRFRRRDLALTEGGKLVLHADGSISQVDGQGEAVGEWATDDPEWPRHAIRFGLLPQPATTTPADSRVKDDRPPGG
ncbi:MAG: hypothetical protein ABSA21_07295 [Candidatus Limnocylindrales bacterium]